jgi:hypothetical protein
MEKASPTEQMTLFLTHHHLKQIEMELTSKIGSVIVNKTLRWHGLLTGLAKP